MCRPKTVGEGSLDGLVLLLVVGAGTKSFDQVQGPRSKPNKGRKTFCSCSRYQIVNVRIYQAERYEGGKSSTSKQKLLEAWVL